MELKKLVVSAAVLSATVGVAVWPVWSQEATATAPTEAATTQPADTQAQAMLRRMGEAYRDLKSLQVKGTVQLNIDAAGQSEEQKGQFVASYQAPDRFRHEMNDDLLIVSSGEKGYFYSPTEQRFQEMNPKDDPRITAILQQQNPALAMALNREPVDNLLAAVDDVRIGEGVEVEGTTYDRIHFVQGPAQVELLIHPVTHLIHRMTIDLKAAMQMQGIPDVKQAQLRYDYAEAHANAEVAGETFQWTPPEGAQKIEAQSPQDPNPAATRMIGQPAPQATLKNLAGEQIAVGQPSDDVVILDFWATWCGPCVPGLKHLNELAQKVQGVRIYAVNLMESSEQIEQFMQRHSLKLPALLDTEGQVAEQYRVEPIPHTVVIGRDGKIVDVVVGFDPAVAPARLDAAIAKAKGEGQ